MTSSLASARLLAVGDVHGCDTALATLLDLVAPQPHDTVVFLGDLVDRGPGTRQVLDAVLALRDCCQVKLILGNHEEMMLNALNGLDRKLWWQFGGAEAIASYERGARGIPREHIELMQQALPYWEMPSTIFVHANLQPGVPLEQQNGEWLRWTHLTGKERPFDPPRRVVCGHTPQKHGYPIAFPGWVGIDTYAHGGGWLTCLDVDANWVYQATDFGRTREFPLGGTD